MQYRRNNIKFYSFSPFLCHKLALTKHRKYKHFQLHKIQDNKHKTSCALYTGIDHRKTFLLRLLTRTIIKKKEENLENSSDLTLTQGAFYNICHSRYFEKQSKMCHLQPKHLGDTF